MASDFSYQGPILSAVYDGPTIVDNSHFRFNSSEKLSFDPLDYLSSQAPELMPLNETIAAWSAMKSIHPKVLIGMVKAAFNNQAVVASQENKDLVWQIAAGLDEIFAQNKSNPLAASIAISSVSNSFGLMPEFSAELSRSRQSSDENFSGAATLFNYLQPPWPRGEFWGGGGVHRNGGSGSVRNALDFWGGFDDWGDDTSAYWVSAAQAGIARVWSSCSMTVIHPNGWETSYYHLDNIQVNDQSAVIDNQALANYADNEAQALCNGGGSTGPHVHVAVWDTAGDAVLIDESNINFTSWMHHAGEGNYDFDCDTSYYTMLPANNVVCPGWLNLPNNTSGLIDLIYLNGFE
ncbi:M23 family metallopeptidase [Marinicella sp. S1101]|nr:M23 family metallopeptidase [Marinicella marina]MCX7553478.1 M23 family metallopeptidase [Marinicella marina]MDJ1140102.1 M23 family metallopeptidase [Marinicella marina]